MKDSRIQMAAGTYLADQVRAAIFEEDDERIVAAYRGNERLLESLGELTEAEKDRIAVALERVKALADLRAAFVRHVPAEIVRVYLIHANTLEPSRSFVREERRRVIQARRATLLAELDAAIAENDVHKIDLAGKRVVEEGCQLSEAEHSAVQRARRCVVALEALGRALECDNDAAIVDVYQADLLDDCPHLSAAQRRRIDLAYKRVERWQPLRHALRREDDRAIAALYDRALFLGYSLLSDDERARCDLAMQRVEAHERLLAALSSNDPHKILMAYDEDLLAPTALLTAAQRQRIEDARYQVILIKACKSGDMMRIADAYRALVAAHASVSEGVDLDTVLSASRRVDLLESFRRALDTADRNDEEVVRLGGRLIGLWPDLVTDEERRQVRRAKVRLGARSRLQAATGSGDTQRVSMALQHLIALEAPGWDVRENADDAAAATGA
jgi:hypothetical protein